MKFTVNRKTIFEALSNATKGAALNAMLPILANALFEANAETGRIMITCTDLQQRVNVAFNADVAFEGKAAIPASKLLKLLKNLKGADVTFDTDDKNNTTVTCGTTSAVLFGLPTRDFPEVREFSPEIMFSIDVKNLKDLIKHGAYAFNPNDTRQHLKGALFDLQGNEIAVVSTDGKRLGKATHSFAEPFTEAKQYIVPPFALSFLQGLTGDKVDFIFGEKQMLCMSGDIAYTSTLVQGNYPAYQRIIPEKCFYSLKINAETLLSKMQTLAVMSGDKSYISMVIDNEKIDFKNESTSDGTITDSMSITAGAVPLDNPMTIYFNPAYILSALSACGGTGDFDFKFNSEVMPALFDFGNDVIGIIVPIKKKGAATK